MVDEYHSGAYRRLFTWSPVHKMQLKLLLPQGESLLKKRSLWGKEPLKRGIWEVKKEGKKAQWGQLKITKG